MYTICANIVKLQSKVQTSVLGLGVDFVLPLSQQEEQQEEQECKTFHRGAFFQLLSLSVTMCGYLLQHIIQFIIKCDLILN